MLAKCLEEIGGAFFFATYGMFLVSIGVNEMEYMGVNIVFMFAKTILDPLTGNWGDRMGQKKIYLWGLLLWAIGLFVYGFANAFWLCAIAETISGVGAAFRSGALESWLQNLTDEETGKAAQSKAGTWKRLATIPSALLGGIVGSIWGLHMPWIVAGVSSLVAMGAIWLLLRPFPDLFRKHKVSDADLDLWSIAKRAWSDTATRKVFIMVAVMFASIMPFNMYWQRVFYAASIKPEWMGSLWIGIALMTALGAKISGKLPVSSTTLALIVAGIGLPMFWPHLLINLPVLLVLTFLLHEVGRGGFDTIMWAYYNRRVANETRNSLNSLQSAAGSTGAIFGLIIAACLTYVITLPQIWAVSAIALIGLSVWVIRWNHD